jgi:hypothetical protein
VDFAPLEAALMHSATAAPDKLPNLRSLKLTGVEDRDLNDVKDTFEQRDINCCLEQAPILHAAHWSRTK